MKRPGRELEQDNLQVLQYLQEHDCICSPVATAKAFDWWTPEGKVNAHRVTLALEHLRSALKIQRTNAGDKHNANHYRFIEKSIEPARAFRKVQSHTFRGNPNTIHVEDHVHASLHKERKIKAAWLLEVAQRYKRRAQSTRDQEAAQEQKDFCQHIRTEYKRLRKQRLEHRS